MASSAKRRWPSWRSIRASWFELTPTVSRVFPVSLALLPLPLAGEGGGEGLRSTTAAARRPSPQPSPKGRGSKTPHLQARTASWARRLCDRQGRPRPGHRPDLAAPGCAVPGTHRDSSIPVDFDRLSVGVGKSTHAPQRRRGRRESQRNTDWFFLCAFSATSAPHEKQNLGGKRTPSPQPSRKRERGPGIAPSPACGRVGQESLPLPLAGEGGGEGCRTTTGIVSPRTPDADRGLGCSQANVALPLCLTPGAEMSKTFPGGALR